MARRRLSVVARLYAILATLMGATLALAAMTVIMLRDQGVASDQISSLAVWTIAVLVLGAVGLARLALLRSAAP